MTKSDIPAVAGMMARAFADDPVWASVFADVDQKDRRFQAFFEIPLRYCLRYGHVVATSQALEGVVAWMPGRLAAMPAIRMLLSGAIGPALRLGPQVPKRLPGIFNPVGLDRARWMGKMSYLYVSL